MITKRDKRRRLKGQFLIAYANCQFLYLRSASKRDHFEDCLFVRGGAGMSVDAVPVIVILTLGFLLWRWRRSRGAAVDPFAQVVNRVTGLAIGDAVVIASVIFIVFVMFWYRK